MLLGDYLNPIDAIVTKVVTSRGENLNQSLLIYFRFIRMKKMDPDANFDIVINAY